MLKATHHNSLNERSESSFASQKERGQPVKQISIITLKDYATQFEWISHTKRYKRRSTAVITKFTSSTV